MGRLKALPPRLSAMAPRIGYAAPVDEAERSRQRDGSQAWRRWYKTARWQKLRMDVLVRDLFTCQMPDCRRIDLRPGQLICDHVEPHHGNEASFWAGPFQTLCKTCHDGAKQRAERRGR